MPTSTVRNRRDHRAAALEGFGLTLEEVAKVKGVVIAGRTPKDASQERVLRGASWHEIDVYTYDDILSSVTEVVRQIASC